MMLEYRVHVFRCVREKNTQMQFDKHSAVPLI